MSKKRTSPESINDEQTKQSSDSVFQLDENSKCARLTSSSATTLRDLPVELIECILIEVVAMEVKGMKMAKSVWKEKADLVVCRLGMVSSYWSSILATNCFRTRLHRNLDGTAHKTIRVEILDRSPILLGLCIIDITTMKDEIFVLGVRPGEEVVSDEDDGPGFDAGHFAVYVYDRSNTAVVKDVIPLPRIDPKEITGCIVSNCLYMLNIKRCRRISILRITKDEEQHFTISLLVDDMLPSHRSLSTTATGDLILLCIQKNQLPMLSLYNANGCLERSLSLSFDVPWFRNMIHKSNGNLVVVSTDEGKTRLKEIDLDGTILRQYQSSLNDVCQADIHGRIFLTDSRNRIKLMDSEFNPLEFSDPHFCMAETHYNSEHNEVVAILTGKEYGSEFLTVFHFVEE